MTEPGHDRARHRRSVPTGRLASAWGTRRIAVVSLFPLGDPVERCTTLDEALKRDCEITETGPERTVPSSPSPSPLDGVVVLRAAGRRCAA